MILLLRQDLGNHRAVVMLPYAVHSYGVVEVFSLSIPIFTPTIDFALELQLFTDKNVADMCIHYCGAEFIPPPADPNSPHPFSPEDRSLEAQRYWLRFGDLYQYPYIQYFKSWVDLIDQLNAADFLAIHRNMTAFNVKRRGAVERALKGIAESLPARGTIPQDWSQAIAPWGPSLMSH